MSNDTTPTKICTKCGQGFPATTEYFNRRSNSRDGLKPHCKACQAEEYLIYRQKNLDKVRSKGRDYYHANAEKARIYRKRYVAENPEKEAERHRKYRESNRDEILRKQREKRQSDPEAVAEYKRQYYIANKERLVEKGRLYYTNNKERVATQGRLYRQKNAEKIAKRAKLYRQNNPRDLHKIRIRASRRRARVRQLPDTFTVEQWFMCLEYFNYCCAVCGNQLRDLFGNVEPNADHWIPISNPDCPGTVAENMVCLCNKCNGSKWAKLPYDWLKEQFGTRKANEIFAHVETYFAWVQSQE